MTHMWRSEDELSEIVGGPCGFWCWNSGLQAWQQVSHLAVLRQFLLWGCGTRLAGPGSATAFFSTSHLA